jgi:predicted ATP-grasp superfamily ATP-dependent carboligase
MYLYTFGSNHDLAFILFVAAAFVFINFYDKCIGYFIYQKPLFDKITKLEQEIQWLKKNDRMRDTDQEALMKSNCLQAEEQNYQFQMINEQLKNIQKQMKRMDKEVKMYN